MHGGEREGKMASFGNNLEGKKEPVASLAGIHKGSLKAFTIFMPLSVGASPITWSGSLLGEPFLVEEALSPGKFSLT